MISKGFVVVILGRLGCCRDVRKMITNMVFAKDKRLYDEYQRITKDRQHSTSRIAHWNRLWYKFEAKQHMIPINPWGYVWGEHEWQNVHYRTSKMRKYNMQYVEHYNRAIDLLSE